MTTLGQGSPPLRLFVFTLFPVVVARLLRLWSFLDDLAGPGAALGGFSSSYDATSSSYSSSSSSSYQRRCSLANSSLSSYSVNKT